MSTSSQVEQCAAMWRERSMFSAIFFRTLVAWTTSSSRVPGAVKEGAGMGFVGWGAPACGEEGARPGCIPGAAAGACVPAAAATLLPSMWFRTSSRVTRPPSPLPRMPETSRLCSLRSFRTAGETR